MGYLLLNFDCYEYTPPLINGLEEGALLYRSTIGEQFCQYPKDDILLTTFYIPKESN